MESLKYIIFFKSKEESKSNYMLALGNTSKKIMPKKLIYIGNYDLFKAASDEKKVEFKDLYLYYEWKFFDIYVLEIIKKNLFGKA